MEKIDYAGSVSGLNSGTRGCAHYKRNVQLLAPCCKKIYTCRICHDDAEDHSLKTKLVSTLICMRCHKNQMVRGRCVSCNVVFGEAYACLSCRLFDNEFKNQYHCKDCGICRIGPASYYFHCPRCNLCLHKNLKDNHKCIDNVSRDNCPICIENLHRSTKLLFLSTCGHFIHMECYETMSKAGQKECPICKSMLASKMDEINTLMNRFAL